MSKCDKCWGTGEALNHRMLGREARNRRLARKIGLTDAAGILGVSPAMLSLLEAGKRRWTEVLWAKTRSEYGN